MDMRNLSVAINSHIRTFSKSFVAFLTAWELALETFSSTLKIFLTCLPLLDEEMLRIGFLNELVDPSELQSTVDRYVLALCESEKSVTESMKRHIDKLSAGNSDAFLGVNEYKKSLHSPELAGRLSGLLK
jgi:enoyl-CoA hydratase/carnithine racemase